MARPSFGDVVQPRVKRLLEVLLAYANHEFENSDRFRIKFDWQSPTQLVIETKLQVLASLTKEDNYEGELTKNQVSEALKRLEDFLEILQDNRTSIRGSATWHFTLKLWHKEKEANLKQFDIEWDKKRSPKSQAVAQKTAISKTDRQDIKPTPYENLNRQGVERWQFVGRNEKLEELHELLQQNPQVAITAAVVGMGGVGKTELAIQYARDAREKLSAYPGGVCLLSASGFPLNLVEFARPRFFPQFDIERLSPPERVTYCWLHWAEGEVLVVIDDVTDYQQVKPYLPESPRFKVLMTTREKLGKPIVSFDLDVLTSEAALEVLATWVKREEVFCELEGKHDRPSELCEWLGYLPLGLELVGRYLDEEPICVADMLAKLKQKRLKHSVLKTADPTMTAKLGVADAFELSWERLDANAQQLGGVLSLFALAPIPWELAESVYRVGLAGKFDEDSLAKSRRDLMQLHLLKTDKEAYRLHQLLREFFRDKLEGLADANEIKQCFATVMAAAAKQIPQQPTRNQILALSSDIPHIEEAARYLTDYLRDEDLTTPFTGLGLFYEGQSLYQEAESWFQQGQQVGENRLGATHPDVANNCNNLAAVYKSQGRYKEAEQLFLRAWELSKDQLRGDNLQALIILNNLAELYKSQQRYRKAKLFYLQALKLSKDLLEEENRQFASSLNNLAELYRFQGHYRKAELLFLKALRLTKNLFLEEHLDVANSIYNLAGLYKSQDRYSEAEPLYLQALAICEARLGVGHPTTMLVRKNYARCLKDYAQFLRVKQIDTELFYEQTLAICEARLGVGHPTTMLVRSNYARCLKDYAQFLRERQIDRDS